MQTQYIVLAQVGTDPERWELAGRATAHNQRAAIAQVADGRMGEDTPSPLEGAGADGTTYVACPARSWEPVKVAAEVQRRLVFE